MFYSASLFLGLLSTDCKPQKQLIFIHTALPTKQKQSHYRVKLDILQTKCPDRSFWSRSRWQRKASRVLCFIYSFKWFLDQRIGYLWPRDNPFLLYRFENVEVKYMWIYQWHNSPLSITETTKRDLLAVRKGYHKDIEYINVSRLINVQKTG